MHQTTRRSAAALRTRSHASTIIAALCELAADVQKRRTVNDILETAGQGVLRLGMRLYAFELTGDDLVLRHLATARSRLQAIEHRIGGPLRGLRAPAAAVPLALEVVRDGRIVHSDDLDVFHSFMRLATGWDPATLEGAVETTAIHKCVLAPIFVRQQPWGLLGVASSTLARDDADAVALFATHVGSAIEVAESIEVLERTNRELVACNVELARAHRELVERERLAKLGELAATMAHEVRTPLCVLFNSIGGLRTFLRTGAPADRIDEANAFASMAGEEASHLNRIVSDVIDFARPHPMDLRVGSLVSVLECVARATALDGRVCVDIAGDLPPVEVDAFFMQRALVNLVLNGLQATAKDGTVTVRAATEQVDGSPFVRVDVVDDGLGIPADVRASIFEPFFTTKQTGAGLGLAIVKQIVDSHGGTLEVEPGPEGTTFTVRLPACLAAV